MLQSHVLQRNPRQTEMLLNALRGVVQLRWRSGPLQQEVEVPLKSVQLILLARQGARLGEYAVELRAGPERLLLVTSYNEREVREIYDVLAPFFLGTARDLSGLVPRTDCLRRVCNQFCGRVFFESWPIVSTPDAQRLVLRNSYWWWIGLVVVLALCLPVIKAITGYTWFETNAPPIFVALTFVIFFGMLPREELRIDAARGLLQFRWGRWPKTTELELPLRGLQLVLFRDIMQSDRVYSLEIRRGTDRLRLLNWNDLASVRKLFEQLAPFFPAAASNRTTEPAPRPRLAAAPIRISHYLERERNRYLQMRGDRAVLRGTWGPTLSIFAIAILITPMAWFVNWLDPPGFEAPLTTANYLLWTLATCTAAIGLWVWPRTVVIAAGDWLRVPGCQWDGKWRGPLHASDIAAVQICNSREAYQVNLVAKAPELCRVNILCDADPTRAEDVANQLANLLRVPLQMHW